MQQRKYLEVGVAYRIRSLSAILRKIIYLHLTLASEGKKGVFLTSYQEVGGACPCTVFDEVVG